MIQAIDEQKPDQVIHLGDLISDAEEISYLYPKLPVCMVPGNCDGWTTVPSIKQITLQGRSILLSHGHLWGVKSGCDAAIARARAAGADILLFGHTHQPLCQPLQLRHHSAGGGADLLHSDPSALISPSVRTFKKRRCTL